jgi:hypothetical protein
MPKKMVEMVVRHPHPQKMKEVVPNVQPVSRSYQWDKVRINSPVAHHPAHLSLVTENRAWSLLVQEYLNKQK